jgi:hypothetical protein
MENQTTILIGLLICHWLADYTHLSTSWMLNAKRLGTPIHPIFVHATVHATLMFLVLNLFFGITGNLLIGLFLFQLITHFSIDLWKGKMNMWFPSLQSPANKGHWIVFGFDQLLHAIVIVVMSSYVCL